MASPTSSPLSELPPPEFSELMRCLEKICSPDVSEDEKRLFLLRNLADLHHGTLESAAPQASLPASKDTPPSPSLSKENDMTDTAKNLQSADISENSAQNQNKPDRKLAADPSLLEFITRHLRAGGLPDHLIEAVHQKALGQENLPPSTLNSQKEAEEKPSPAAAPAPDKAPEAAMDSAPRGKLDLRAIYGVRSAS